MENRNPPPQHQQQQHQQQQQQYQPKQQQSQSQSQHSGGQQHHHHHHHHHHNHQQQQHPMQSQQQQQHQQQQQSQQQQQQQQQQQHQTTITQGYPVIVYDGAEGTGTLSNVQSAVSESLRSRLDEATQSFKCQISYTMAEPSFSRENGRFEFNFVLSISGVWQQVLACRAALLRGNMTQTVVTLKTARNIVLNQNGEMRAVVKRRLDELMKTTRTHITCVGQALNPMPPLSSPDDPASVNASAGSAGLPAAFVHDFSARPNVIDIEIVGHWEAVERARMRCLVLLDNLFGLASTVIEIDPKLHPIIAGQQRAYLNLIMRETFTNIYFPSMLVVHSLRPGHTEPAVESDTYPSSVFITGPAEGVARAKDLLLAAADTKSSKVMTKHVPCLPRKLDWLFMHRKSHVRRIASDNGVFIALPPLGSNSNVVTFFGDHQTYIERAVRAIMQLVCEYYISCIQLLVPENIQKPLQQYFKDLQHQFLHISLTTGVEFVIQRQFIEIYGLAYQIKQAYQDVFEMDFIKTSVRDTKFQVELALEHREFINGKKNGKINKIIKTANCRIIFQDNYNDYNMLIDLYSPTPSRALDGLQMLEDELPAEISFHIPEAYHKRIIGVGGKNIQKIMKKFGVYVKFSSTEEYAALGGYYENEDNVIARTPAKNGENLKDLKYTIVESINAMDLLDVKAAVSIPRQLHALFSGYQGRTILDIEAKTKVRITLPDCESGSDTVMIEGPESQLEVARLEIQSNSPVVFDFDLPASAAAHQALASAEFLATAQQLKDEYGMAMHIYAPVAEPEAALEYTIYLIHPPSLSRQRLEDAKKTITGFLSRMQVPLSSVARSGSYANLAPPQATYDSFQHFNSKLLATVTTPDPQASIMVPSFSLFGSKSGPTGSVPNLRQLFDDAPNMPPGLRRSGSEVKPQPSAIGRPRNLGGTGTDTPKSSSSQPSTANILSETTDYLRHSQLHHRASLTMPDLLSLGDVQSTHHTTEPMQPFPGSSGSDAGSGLGGRASISGASSLPMSTSGSAPSTSAPIGSSSGAAGSSPSSLAGRSTPLPGGAQNRWAAPPPIGKSLSSTSIMSGDITKGKPPLRGHSSFIASDTSQVDPTEDDHTIEFDTKIVDDVLGSFAKDTKDFDQVAQVLESIAHSKYLHMFIEHEIDFATFLSLEDADLKELGIKALGSRKKIIAAIQECKANQGATRSQLQSQSQQPQPQQQSSIFMPSSGHNQGLGQDQPLQPMRHPSSPQLMPHQRTSHAQLLPPSSPLQSSTGFRQSSLQQQPYSQQLSQQQSQPPQQQRQSQQQSSRKDAKAAQAHQLPTPSQSQQQSPRTSRQQLQQHQQQHYQTAQMASSSPLSRPATTMAQVVQQHQQPQPPIHFVHQSGDHQEAQNPSSTGPPELSSTQSQRGPPTSFAAAAALGTTKGGRN
ncbi:hypothetical protein BC831DRAFT_445007 [Entophlyctis helioformis]|nr:hypothetical protein BC831DRAFT_445007 [Entophlyctis helioformis]